MQVCVTMVTGVCRNKQPGDLEVVEGAHVTADLNVQISLVFKLVFLILTVQTVTSDQIGFVCVQRTVIC